MFDQNECLFDRCLILLCSILPYCTINLLTWCISGRNKLDTFYQTIDWIIQCFFVLFFVVHLSIFNGHVCEHNLNNKTRFCAKRFLTQQQTNQYAMSLKVYYNIIITLLQASKLHIQHSIQWQESHICCSIYNVYIHNKKMKAVCSIKEKQTQDNLQL